MKILLQRSYGFCPYPKEVQNLIKQNESLLLSQAEKMKFIGDIVEKRYPINNLDDTHIEETAFEEGYCRFVLKNGDDIIIFPLKQEECSTKLYGQKTCSFTVQVVDTTRPWIIEEYDGVESIMYLDNYECIDKELNYYKIKTKE